MTPPREAAAAGTTTSGGSAVPTVTHDAGAAAYPYVAGQPCPICGVSLLTNDKNQVYCGSDGVYPMPPDPKQMNAVDRAHEERRLRLAQLRPLDN